MAVKFIALPLAGTAGVLGTSSPLIHISVTKSNYKTKWYERVDLSQPIFQNCRIDDKNPLNVYLAFVGGANNSPENKKVSLKVVEKPSGGGKEQVVWESGKENSGQDVWKELKLKYSGDGNKTVQFMYPYRDKWDQTTKTNLATCNIKQVEFVTFAGNFRSSEYIYLKDIELTFWDKCTEGFSSVKCEISIKKPDNKIQWVKGFKPKIIYTAF